MTTPRPRRPLVASLPLIAAALIATVAAAQTPVPPSAAAGAVAERSMTMDSIRARASAQRELIQTLVAKYYPGVLTGAVDAHRILFVLDKDDNFVTTAVAPGEASMGNTTAVSGSGEAGAVAMMRASGGGAGGSAGSVSTSVERIGAGAGGGAGASVGVGGGASAGAMSGAVVARASAGPSSPELNLSAYGVGSIDRSLIRGTASSSFRPGLLGPGGVDVYLVRLK